MNNDNMMTAMVAGYVNFWRRGLMWPLELLRQGERKDVPFQKQPSPSPASQASHSLEELRGREFIAILQSINDISNANSKIGHALAQLWLTRIPSLTTDPIAREQALSQRKAATDELLKGYETLSVEPLKFYVHAFRALLKSFR